MTDHVPVTFDHSEMFSDYPLRGGFTERPDDARVRNADHYGAAVVAHRHLRAAAIAMAGTDAASDTERAQVWRVVHALAGRIRTYEQENNLPPADVTP